jgi:hypothetical protein
LPPDFGSAISPYNIIANSADFALISCFSVITPLLVGKRLWLIEAYHTGGLFITGARP